MSGNTGNTDDSERHKSYNSSPMSAYKVNEDYCQQNCIDFINYCQYFQHLCDHKESENVSHISCESNKSNIFDSNVSIRRTRRHSIERKPRQAYNTKQLERLENEFQVNFSSFSLCTRLPL